MSIANSEIIELSSCDNFKDGFLKNEYILDLEKLTMTRNYVFNEKTYQKMLQKIKEEDPKLIKLLKSLETQEVIELVLTNKLDK